MTGQDLVSVLPLVVLGAAAVLIMLAISFYRNHALTCLLTLAGLAGAAVSLPIASSAGVRRVTALLIVDGYALFYMGMILAAAFAVTIISYLYLERREGRQEELYILLLLATLGSAVLVSSSHFASLFLGLEILSASLFTLIAYPRGRLNIEAGVKYLILAAVSAAFLLFGMALVYADLGTLEFTRMTALARAGGSGGLLFPAGLGLLIIGLGFKLALVPFHMWTPDVYQGAPAPVTAFVATVSKVAVFGLMLRFFNQVGIRPHAHLFYVFEIIAIASMFAGSLLALLQDNVKRILAYSSIAHLGYLLVAFLASGSLAITAVTFYLVAYTVTTLGTFGVVALMSGSGREADALNDYRGLFWSRPWLAGVFAAMIFSLAGIPLTAGFIGKFYLLDAGVDSSLWLLVFSLVASSSIGLYYYLRIIVVMYMQPRQDSAKSGVAAASHLRVGSLVMAVLLLAVVLLGIYPAPLIELIQKTVTLN
ncbi:MAG: NADH-quinone oxidoreductase subunit N [Actinobacteria bacterium]|nr:NADH-quinone oxidoreductase subunit N [Actinomycetota bacterium]